MCCSLRGVAGCSENRHLRGNRSFRSLLHRNGPSRVRLRPPRTNGAPPAPPWEAEVIRTCLFGQFYLEPAGTMKYLGRQIYIQLVLAPVIGEAWSGEPVDFRAAFLHWLPTVDVASGEGQDGIGAAFSVEDCGDGGHVGTVKVVAPAGATGVIDLHYQGRRRAQRCDRMQFNVPIVSACDASQGRRVWPVSLRLRAPGGKTCGHDQAAVG